MSKLAEKSHQTIRPSPPGRLGPIGESRMGLAFELHLISPPCPIAASRGAWSQPAHRRFALLQRGRGNVEGLAVN